MFSGLDHLLRPTNLHRWITNLCRVAPYAVPEMGIIVLQDVTNVLGSLMLSYMYITLTDISALLISKCVY